MGEVVAFRPKPAPVVADELAELTAWLKPASDWWTGWMQIEMAKGLHMAADCRRLLVAREQGKESSAAVEASEIAEKAFRDWEVQCLRQLFIPARYVRHLRWKQEWARIHCGGIREIGLALARDEAALARRLEVVGRQQAGRRRKVVQS